MTEEMNTTKNIDDILKVMDKANSSFTYGVWVPSLDKEVQFKELKTAHQKMIVKTIIDSPVYNTQFIVIMQEVINQICADKIDTDKLNILDKFFILLKVRSVCIGNKVELEAGKVVDLEEVIENAKKGLTILKPKSIKDKNGIYKIKIDVPSIKEEAFLEQALRKDVESITEMDAEINMENLREILNNTFTGELVKYIREIEISDKDKEEKITINLSDLGLADRIKLIDSLPTTISEKVVSYIEKVRNEINKIVTVKVLDGKKFKEEKLSIDGTFFTNS